MVDERRKHVRRTVSLECQWEGTSPFSASRITQLGMGGCYVDTRDVPSFSEQITLIAIFGDGPLTLRGRVVYAQPLMGFGVEFKGVDASARARLERFLSSAADRP